MTLNMRIEVTSGVAATEVPADVAADLTEAYNALKDLPVNRMVVVDFTADGYDGPAKVDGKTVTDAQKAAYMARKFVRQGKAWAAAQAVTVDITDDDGTKTGERKSALTFARKGDIKANPARVSFRIYVPRPAETSEDQAA
jgi:hypothetical protein